MAESIPGDHFSEVKLQDSLWYAVYTRSRFEKRLMELLSAKGIEAYVPLHKVVRQWSDRKKVVEEPLIRSYCFVKVESPDYYEVLNTPGAVRYVWFSGRPATIPEKQIDILKSITSSMVETKSLPDTFRPGTRVRINGGPLMGLTGELVTIANKKKVILRLDQLQQVISFTISPLLIDVVSGQSMLIK